MALLLYNILKYICNISLLLKQYIQIYESTVIFNTGQVGHNIRV